MLSVKKKEVEMNRSYNHIKHFVDTTDYVESITDNIELSSPRLHVPVANYGANQLDDQQSHTRFDYYEYDMPKCGVSGWGQSSLNRSTIKLSTINFQEHHEDSEDDQARHQGIHKNGQNQTC